MFISQLSWKRKDVLVLSSISHDILNPAFLLRGLCMWPGLLPNKRILGQCFPSLIQPFSMAGSSSSNRPPSSWNFQFSFYSRFSRYDNELVSLVVATEWIMMALQRRFYLHGSKRIFSCQEQVDGRWCPSSSFWLKMQERWGFNWP